MLVFAASDKGGTGRSVTSANLAYRRALSGDDVCYLDFDFGSPTAAAVFNIPDSRRGRRGSGLHSYLKGLTPEPERIDVWRETEHEMLRDRPIGSGRLTLIPGDPSGAEFSIESANLVNCVSLFLRLEEEFDVIVVDLSAGRSYAMDMALTVTARPEMRGVLARWLVYHRWTRQHIIAAAGLVYGERGILEHGVHNGHDADELADSIRFVRAAVPDPDAALWARVSLAQSAWMRKCDQELQQLAADRDVGPVKVLGTIPFEPVLQWREQLITDEDVLDSTVANEDTWTALVALAEALVDDAAWGGL